MRAIFGVLSLLAVLAVLAVVGVLAKKQLAAMSAASIHQQNPARVDQSVTLPVTSADATQQIQQQIKQSVEAAMQQPRPMPDDAK